MSLVTELANMNLRDASEAISRALIIEKSKLEEAKIALSEKEKACKQAYIAANTGDSSENAPLDEAKKDLRMVSGEILVNLKVLQSLDDLEDVEYLVDTYDYTDLESSVCQLDEETFKFLTTIFHGLSRGNVKEYFTSLSIDNLERYKDELLNWITENKNANTLDVFYNKLSDFFEVASMPPYNTCGIVKMYSTVRLECSNGDTTETMVYKIYPAGLSFLDIGIIAADSRVAKAILEKQVGDTVDIPHASKNLHVLYKILEVY